MLSSENGGRTFLIVCFELVGRTKVSSAFSAWLAVLEDDKAQEDRKRFIETEIVLCGYYAGDQQ